MCYEHEFFLQVGHCIREMFLRSGSYVDGFYLVLAVIFAYLSIRTYAGSRGFSPLRPPKLISIGDKPFPRTLRKMDVLLRSLGYLFLSAAVTKYPGIKKLDWWIHISRDYEIVVMTKSITVHYFSYIMTLFEDDSLIITFYATGTTFDSPQLQTSFARRSLENALTHQRTKIEEWKPQHGVPVKIQTTNDFTRLINLYYERHHPLISPYFQREWMFVSISYAFMALSSLSISFSPNLFALCFAWITLVGATGSLLGLFYNRKFWQAVDHRRLK